MRNLKIAIIGAGNMAWQLSRVLEDAGHMVALVWARSIAQAEELANNVYEAEATDDTDLSEADIEVFILAVADDAIAEVASSLVFPSGALLVHTSGSRSITQLGDHPGPKGVLYPLQTISRAKAISLAGVPICLEADGEEAEELLFALASSLSKDIYWLNHEQRLALHVAAVFASNFTNHMLALAKDVLDAEELPFKMLRPLVRETIEKAFLVGPAEGQTGPAKREDYITMSLHLRHLGENPDLHQLYQTVSDSIIAHSEREEE